MVNEGEHHFGYRLRLWQLKPAPAEQLDVWKIAGRGGGCKHPQVYATRQKKNQLQGQRKLLLNSYRPECFLLSLPFY